jgi:hypothetical protein
MRFAGSAIFPWKRTAIAAGAVLAVGALALGPLHIATGNYDGRNGAAEALDDVIAGLPLKLYEHQHNQIGASSRTPGVYCPSAGSSAFAKLKRVRIEEAGFAEGRTLTRTESRRAQAARAFAYLYNTTMFDAHRSELRRACPGVLLQPFSPNLRLERVE